LNWNGWPHTTSCLRSLQELDYDNHEVIVVDNGSTDDSVRRLRHEFPSTELIQTNKNLGFAGGCNVGIRRAFQKGARFVWLLNTDSIVDPQALDSLVKTANLDSRIAAVGSAIFCMDEPERLQAWGGGRVNFLLGRSRHFLQPVRDAELDYITGASILLRRAALESAGLLDEGFFFFWEDADLGFRLRKANWTLAVAAGSKIWHRESASLRGKGTLLDSHFNRAAIRFFHKHALIPQIPIYFGMTLRVLKRVLSGDWDRARAVWSASREAYPS
jgi:GT2 family glycosyltransferase